MSRTTTKIVRARSDGTIMGQYVLGLGEHIIGREIDSAIYIDDPHVSRSHARLIFTEEAVESYRKHLKPDGVFAMYNFMRESWLVDRYAATLNEEFAQPPCVIDAEARFLSVLVAADKANSINCPDDSNWLPSHQKLLHLCLMINLFLI